MAKVGKNSDDFDTNQGDLEEELPTVSLTDEAGRSLVCYVEHSVEVDGQAYLLLLPVDSPIEIFAWEDDEDEDAETLVDLADTQIEEIFETARAVLAEQDLTLKRTAYTLTAVGELPDVSEEDVITIDVGEEDGPVDSEQFQRITSFYHEEQEYDVCTPLDPLMFFARVNSDGNPELLSPEEFQAVRPQLEEQLFDSFE
ncbi:MAG: DUF3727 domain-containing protein [Elainellaceae cyanobacterium]